MKVIVCDRCRSDQDVHELHTSCGSADLCGACAIEALRVLATVKSEEVRSALRFVLGDRTDPPAAEPEAAPLDLTQEQKNFATATQRRNALASEHLVDVFFIQLDQAPAKLPCQVNYGTPPTPVMVLEKVPVADERGNYFAKIVV